MQTTERCFELLEERLNCRITQSQRYNTPAFPAGSGPEFVNAAGKFETTLHPTEILEILHGVEAEADRIRETRWAARTLDIDLIAVGKTVVPSAQEWTYWAELPLDLQLEKAPESLILPHPRVQDRAFALVPLCDVAESWVHPVLGRSLRSLCDACSKDALDEVRAL